MAGKGAKGRCVQLLDVDPSDEANVPLEVDETKEDVDPKDDKIWRIEVYEKNEGLFEGNFVSCRSTPSMTLTPFCKYWQLITIPSCLSLQPYH